MEPYSETSESAPAGTIRNALSQIHEIRNVLRNVQIFRGYRPRTIALTGLAALTYGSYVSASQSVPGTNWFLIGVVCFSVVFLEMIYDYSISLSSLQQKLARQVLAQFLPPIAVAGALSAAILCNGLDQSLLPGMWSSIYGLSLFAARPQLPHGVGWVASYFAVAGILLWMPTGLELGFVAMPIVFGFGQLFLASILHWERPRNIPEGVTK